MTTFGRDTSCMTELRTGRYATGVMLVAEAAYRRLTTPRGALRGEEEEANYGLDLAELVGTNKPNQSAASLEGRIKQELEKDERIETATATVVESSDGPGRVFQVAVEAFTAEGPFTLQLAVDSVTVELIGFELPEAA